jgi:hypothetical protein
MTTNRETHSGQDIFVSIEVTNATYSIHERPVLSYSDLMVHHMKQWYTRAIVPILALVFVLLAWRSIWQEVSGTGSIDRDMLWDVSKFGFLVCVLNLHVNGCYALETCAAKFPHSMWYTEFMLPGFFVIAGLLQQNKDIWDWKSVERTLRDNIINNYAYIAIVLAATASLPFAPKGHDVSLWFLTAIALYRLVLFPIVKGLTWSLGHLQGSVVSMVIVVGWYFLLDHIVGPQVEYLIMIREEFTVMPARKWHSVIRHSPFYVLGLVVNRNSMRQFLASPSAFACAFPCVFLSKAIVGLMLKKENVVGIVPWLIKD